MCINDPIRSERKYYIFPHFPYAARLNKYTTQMYIRVRQKGEQQKINIHTFNSNQNRISSSFEFGNKQKREEIFFIHQAIWGGMKGFNSFRECCIQFERE